GKRADERVQPERRAPRTRDDALHGTLAPAVRARHHAGRARGDQRRDAVGRRRCIAEIACKRCPALNLGRADQVGGLDHPGPGLPESLAFADHGTGGCGTDHEAALALADAGDAGAFLGLDNQVGLSSAGPQLNEQIGPAGKDVGSPGRSGVRAHGLLDGGWSGMSEHGRGPPERAGRNTTPCFSETKSRDTCCSQPVTIACICAPAARPSCSAIRRSGEAPMTDVATKVTAKETAKETAKQIKIETNSPVT